MFLRRNFHKSTLVFVWSHKCCKFFTIFSICCFWFVLIVCIRKYSMCVITFYTLLTRGHTAKRIMETKLKGCNYYSLFWSYFVLKHAHSDNILKFTFRRRRRKVFIQRAKDAHCGSSDGAGLIVPAATTNNKKMTWKDPQTGNSLTKNYLLTHLTKFSLPESRRFEADGASPILRSVAITSYVVRKMTIFNGWFIAHFYHSSTLTKRYFLFCQKAILTKKFAFSKEQQTFHKLLEKLWQKTFNDSFKGVAGYFSTFF